MRAHVRWVEDVETVVSEVRVHVLGGVLMEPGGGCFLGERYPCSAMCDLYPRAFATTRVIHYRGTSPIKQRHPQAPAFR